MNGLEFYGVVGGSFSEVPVGTESIIDTDLKIKEFNESKA